MEVKYTIAASDGKTYGPVTLAEIQSWIRDGRVAAQTQVLRSDVNSWFPASQYQELNLAATPTPPPLTQSTGYGGSAAPFEDPALLGKLKTGANWFYWIAGISLFYGLSAINGGAGRRSPIFGLGMVLHCGDFGKGNELLAYGCIFVLCALFIVCGILGNKRHLWAMILGLTVYILDTLLLLLPPQSWFSVAFHAWALFGIFSGLKACMELKKQPRS